MTPSERWKPLDIDATDAPPPARPTAGTHVVALLASPGVRSSGWAPRAAVEIARGWGADGARVVLCDAGFESPSLHEAAGLDNLEGVSDALLFGTSFQRLGQPLSDGLFLATAGTAVPHAEALRAHPRWRDFAEGFAGADAVLVLYLPLDAPGADALLELCQGALVLGEEGEMESLPLPGLPLLGVMGPTGAPAPPLAADEPEPVEAAFGEVAVRGDDEPASLEEAASWDDEPASLEEVAPPADDEIESPEAAFAEPESPEAAFAQPELDEPVGAESEESEPEPTEPEPSEASASFGEALEEAAGEVAGFGEMEPEEGMAPPSDDLVLEDWTQEAAEEEPVTPPSPPGEEAPPALEPDPGSGSWEMESPTPEEEPGADEAAAAFLQGDDDLLLDPLAPDDMIPGAFRDAVEEETPDLEKEAEFNALGEVELAPGFGGTQPEEGGDWSEEEEEETDWRSGAAEGLELEDAVPEVELEPVPQDEAPDAEMQDPLDVVDPLSGRPEAAGAPTLEDILGDEEEAALPKREERPVVTRPRRREEKPKRRSGMGSILLLILLLAVLGVLVAGWAGFVEIPFITPSGGSGVGEADAAEVDGSVTPVPAVDAVEAEGEVADPAAVDPATGEPVSLESPVAAYVLALSSWSDLESAQNRAKAYNVALPDVQFIVAPVEVDGRPWYRLLAGPAVDRAQLEEVRDRLARARTGNQDDWIIREARLAYLVGAPPSLELAQRQTGVLEGLGIPAHILAYTSPEGETRYRIYSGAYANAAEARYLARLLEENNIDLDDVPLTERRGIRP